MRRIIFFSAILCIVGSCRQGRIWETAKSTQWYAKQPWLVGCNFIPSSAINELEMWQAETFDSATINRELGWAHSIGMNVVRVFLHNIPWQTDAKAFILRMEDYLSIADHNHIKTLFVLFDDCWNDNPLPGRQPSPKLGVHNSGWMRCPSKKMHDDPRQWALLKGYVKGILQHFRNDPRIVIWDLYNEAGNSNYNEQSLPLLKKAFQWAWQVRPSQPLTAGFYSDEQDKINAWLLNNSDIISFHDYDSVAGTENRIKSFLQRGRPIICTEYMARPRKSTFETHLPLFKKYHVGAINWGFVSGKTNTIFAWDLPIDDGAEPKIWFHDIFRKNGVPYDEKEAKFIKHITAN